MATHIDCRHTMTKASTNYGVHDTRRSLNHVPGPDPRRSDEAVARGRRAGGERHFSSSFSL